MDPLKMRQLALAVVTPGKCRTAVCNVGQPYPDEISGPQNWCTALKYSNLEHTCILQVQFSESSVMYRFVLPSITICRTHRDAGWGWGGGG